MGFSDASVFLKITFILLIVALIIQILAVALPYWYSYDASSVATAHGGLFRTCVEINDNKNCANVKNAADWWEATQAMELIGLLLIVAALVLCIVVLFVKNDMKILKLICWVLCFCSFGFIIIGVIIFGAELPDLNVVYEDAFSGAFAIAIVAAVICLVAGVLALIDWVKA